MSDSLFVVILFSILTKFCSRVSFSVLSIIEKRPISKFISTTISGLSSYSLLESTEQTNEKILLKAISINMYIRALIALFFKEEKSQHYRSRSHNLWVAGSNLRDSVGIFLLFYVALDFRALQIYVHTQTYSRC